MDQLEEWRVRGRVATAIRNVKEALLHVVINSQELNEAMAEAERLGMHNPMATSAGGSE